MEQLIEPHWTVKTLEQFADLARVELAKDVGARRDIMELVKEVWQSAQPNSQQLASLVRSAVSDYGNYARQAGSYLGKGAVDFLNYAAQSGSRIAADQLAQVVNKGGAYARPALQALQQLRPERLVQYVNFLTQNGSRFAGELSQLCAQRLSAIAAEGGENTPGALEALKQLARINPRAILPAIEELEAAGSPCARALVEHLATLGQAGKDALRQIMQNGAQYGTALALFARELLVKLGVAVAGISTTALAIVAFLLVAGGLTVGYFWSRGDKPVQPGTGPAGARQGQGLPPAAGTAVTQWRLKAGSPALNPMNSPLAYTVPKTEDVWDWKIGLESFSGRYQRFNKRKEVVQEVTFSATADGYRKNVLNVGDKLVVHLTANARFGQDDKQWWWEGIRAGCKGLKVVEVQPAGESSSEVRVGRDYGGRVVPAGWRTVTLEVPPGARGDLSVSIFVGPNLEVHPFKIGPGEPTGTYWASLEAVRCEYEPVLRK